MANTFASDLVVDSLRDAAITTLSSRLASLNGFSRDFSADQIRPLSTVQVPIASAGAAVQTNATNFESGDSTLENAAVSVSQYSASFALTNAEINQGFRIEQLAAKNLRQLANKIIDVAFAPVTVANFGAAVVDVDTAQDVTASSLKTLWGALKDGSERNLIVDGSIYAQFLPSNLDGYTLAGGGRNVGIFGFDRFDFNNRWDGAGANIRGFAASPEAIALASGVPVSSPVSDDLIAQENILIGDLGLTVQMSMWSSRATRSLWASYDVMFGSAKGDGSALKILALTPA
jgi:hypothetical protein